MFYHLATALEPYFSAFNAFQYHTVRAGAAAVTAFVVSLIIGPRVIAWLRMLKIGQYIKQEHVADLHALHKGKAGTPTMGGMLIILSTLFTCLLWTRLSNRLVVLAMLMLLVLGTLGFIDDYIKMRRKHNQGLSAKGKSLGQLIAGILLGVYLTYNPITVSATNLAERDVVDWPAFVTSLAPPHRGELANGKMRVWEALPEDLRAQLTEAASSGRIGDDLKTETVRRINALLEDTDLYDGKVWAAAELNGEGKRILKDGSPHTGEWEHARLNRMLLEAAYPEHIVRSERNLHTKVAVPSFKQLYIPLGAFYIFFVVILIFSSSNAVNLTDGLDGLAIGASIVSLLVYTGIAYVVSRVDWSNYLFLTYVPEASELTVFGAAMLGSGLGFLWYNSHPAEVFMGDTGSLALGGAIGTMALLTKQELLLVLVGGLFVIEAGSVVLQVASFKLRGKRIFRMAPLHHHFELKGWSESKVTIRFWILAIIFALMSLATLKLRYRMDVRGKKVTVVGLGRTSLALVRLLLREGARPYVTDSADSPKTNEFRRELEALGVPCECGGHSAEAFRDAALIVPSPGVPPGLPVFAEARAAGADLVGEMEFAFAFCTSRILAVSGTNGKTTTTELLRTLVEACGHTVLLAGNNALPFSAAVQADPAPEYIVLEVSSYQLETARDFRPWIGAVLNVTPDHLARHGTIENYAAVKAAMFRNQGPDEVAVVNADDPLVRGMADGTRADVRAFSLEGRTERGLWLDGDVVREGDAVVARVTDTPLPGRHNLQNVLCALSMMRAGGFDWPRVLEGLRRFRGVEHRIEHVASPGGVDFYNDSKSTNIDSLKVALESFTRPVVLIAGGRGKGADYRVLCDLVRRTVRHLVTLGEDASLLEDAFGGLVPTERATDMEDAVRRAAEAAQPGDAVLLSPACASFDMYDDFEHRGRVFKEIVRQYAERVTV